MTRQLYWIASVNSSLPKTTLKMTRACDATFNLLTWDAMFRFTYRMEVEKKSGCFTNLHKMASMRCENKIPKLREEDIRNFLKSDERCSRRRKVGRVLGGDETRKRCLANLEICYLRKMSCYHREAHRDRKDDSILLWIFLACGYVSQD
jgi:hypothetical protein